MRLHRTVLLCAAVTVGSAVAVPASLAASVQPGGAHPNDHRIMSNVLTGVSALSAEDVWVVGNHPTAGSDYTPLVRHYDGTGWSDVGEIDEAGDFGYPTSVFALSDSDVWVTMLEDASGQPVVQHWDGTAWQRQDMRAPGTSSNLYHVWASSPSDVWAVGTYQDGFVVNALVEHFDGTSWTRLATPTRTGDTLFGVSGTSATDVWAVGSYSPGGSVSQALFLHWDGTTWKAKGRFDQSGPTGLESVTALSPTDVWAVGTTFEEVKHHGLIMHWNGRHWRESRTKTTNRALLYSVSAASADSIWAVGSSGGQRTTAVHWDGHAWQASQPKNPGSDHNELMAVSADAPDDAWAVGFGADEGGPGWFRIVQHWNGTAWTR